jgi:hypothetical protein
MVARKHKLYLNRWVLLAVTLFWVMGMGVASAGQANGPASVRIDDTAEPLRINATIMEINLKLGYVIIAEKKFELVEYAIDQQKFKLSPEKLKHLKKEMRVIATGFALADGRIIAESIEAVKPKK